MTSRTDDHSRRRTARIAGGLYLAFFATSVLSDLLGQLNFGDSTAIVAAAATHPLRFRLAFVLGLLSALSFLLAAWALHALLKGVDERLALSFLALNMVGVAVQCAATLFLAAAASLASGGGSLAAQPLEGRRALALLAAGAYRNGFVMAQLFYGAWLLPLGYLVFKSGFLPRALGLLLMLECPGILVWFFQCFLLPGREALAYPGWVIGFVAELSLTAWLLVRGVRSDGDLRGRSMCTSYTGPVGSHDLD
jgi:hypothetical protein